MMINQNDRSLFDAESTAYVEALYEQFLENPSRVDPEWRSYFSALTPQDADGSGAYVSHQQVRDELVERARDPEPPAGRSPATGPVSDASTLAWSTKQSAVLRMIYAYRLLGHVRAKVDPIDFRPLPMVPDLDPFVQGLTEEDMDQLFHTGSLAAPDYLPLRQILDILQSTYTHSVGCEYMHITQAEQKAWLQHRIESTRTRAELNPKRRRSLLRMLMRAEGIEQYLHRRFSGQKRFSMEGGECLIPMIEELVQQAGGASVKEVVIGMAHRGRINVLINLMGKNPADLFSEFEGKQKPLDKKITGDVKYHQGFSTDVQTPGGPVHLALAFNPSHLEIIGPVVEGSSRARQDRRKDSKRRSVLPLLIHGDASIAGQGVIYETLNLSDTRGYGTGGSVHIVVNNQVGFTTSHPRDARSSLYCTDVAKVVQAPIFHVNGDDPEAALWAIQAAVDFRMKFRKDVFIDLVCYRRHGHNEGDEPRVTQPVMYGKIRQQKTTAALYRDRLEKEGVVTREEADEMDRSYRDRLDGHQQVAPHIIPARKHSPYWKTWQPYLNGSWNEAVKTAVPLAEIKSLGEKLTTLPKVFEPHRGVQRILEDRQAMVAGKQLLDWGCAENLAYASLLNDGFAIRLTGQDSCRGTFFHRHAGISDMLTGKRYFPLRHLFPHQPQCMIFDSVLSEEAVLGFEYGYSTTDPKTLTIWEAQYGDFVNGAQVVIDQFISSSEQKWRMFSGLVMMLPHGWEGQGPEHSSARLERFLQLCAQQNMQVVAPTTAGQMFHLLRRQMHRGLRIPLIIMTPKSMLRRKESFSPLSELTSGRFRNVIGDTRDLNPRKVTRLILCSGRIYYEIDRMREEVGMEHVAIFRIEQLYPFPHGNLTRRINRLPNLKEVVWAQEEPRNQGAWYQIQHHLHRCIQPHLRISYAGRVPSSAPAGGSLARHQQRERLLILDALGISRKRKRKPASAAKESAPEVKKTSKAPAAKKNPALRKKPPSSS